MTIGNMIRLMVEAGATPEVLAIAVESVEKISVDIYRQSADNADTSADIRRKKDRVRKREKRARDKDTSMLAEANDAAKSANKRADTSADNSAKNVVILPSSSLFSSKRGNQEEEKKERVTTRARGTRLRADETLWEAERKLTTELGLNPEETWVEFKDYWVGVPGVRGTKLDWPATYRNRVKEIARRRPKNGNSAYQTPAEKRESAFDTARDRIANRFGLRQAANGPSSFTTNTNADGFIESENPAIGSCIEAKPRT